jgi:hypothetical protein
MQVRLKAVVAVLGIALVAGGLGAWIGCCYAEPPSWMITGTMSRDLVQISQRLEAIDSAVLELRSRLDVFQEFRQQEGATASRDGIADGLDMQAKLEKILECVSNLSQASVGAHESLLDAAFLHPEPIQSALERLRESSEVGSEVLVRLISGMTYLDATIALGVPTKKRDPANSFSAGMPVTEWLWDMPQKNVVLLVTFSGGHARWAVFTSRDRLKD